MFFTPFWSGNSLQGLVRNMEEDDVFIRSGNNSSTAVST